MVAPKHDIIREDALLVDHPRKTIDFGNDGTVASLSLRGGLVGFSTPHPERGQVLVVPWAQFPKDKFYDQPYVREYRAKPLKYFEKETAFGLRFGAGDSDIRWSYLEASCPRATWSKGPIDYTSTYVSSARGVIIQQVEMVNSSSSVAANADLKLIANVSLNRAAYTQLTPMGDVSIPDSINIASVSEQGVFQLENPNLPATMTATLHVDGNRVALRALDRSTTRDAVISYESVHNVHLAPGQSRTLHLVLSLDTSQHGPCEAARRHLEHVNHPARLSAVVQSTVRERRAFDMDALAERLGGGEEGRVFAFVVARNADYLLNCCSVRVERPDGQDGGTCVITDHQCLPLGWNRDNYYQTRLLVALLPYLDTVMQPHAVVEWRERIHHVLRSHLVWVYETAQRPQGYWARCYLVSGKPKDTVFQLDQQCYPLLELAEYAAMFATRESGGDWQEEQEFVRRLCRRAVDHVLGTLQQHRWTPIDGEESREPLWLFKTDETPADDAVEYPYHFSSHVLLWHTLNSLATLEDIVPGSINTPVGDWATSVHSETIRSFSTTNPRTGAPMFAYLTSTRGDFQLYHDANDLPSALAPKWGFCPETSQRWKNTLEFAFSTDNREGFFDDGINRGLGSVHTRDPWPLGDSQELLYSQLSGQLLREQEVRHKLARIVQWDGLYPEAIDRHTGATTSKHWFGWPGCFIGTVVLGRAGRQVDGANIIAQHVREQLRAHRRKHEGAAYLPPLIVGLQGPQGSGKSYLAQRTKDLLSGAPSNLNVDLLSTDDLYLPHDVLKSVAHENSDNRLLSGRGLPGTHDIELGRRILKTVKAQGGRWPDDCGRPARTLLRLPSFDKTAYQGYGDRRPADEGAEVRDTLDIFIFEGWSQGFLPIRESALRERYEAMHDPRHRPHFSDHGIGCLLQVDTMLDEYVREWYPFISAFVQIVPPSPTQVFAWRLEAEQALRAANGGRGMTDAQCDDFVARYMPAYELWSAGVRDRTAPWAGAGLAVRIDAGRKVVGIERF